MSEASRYNIYRNIVADAAGILVLARPGSVFGYEIYNAAAAARFVKLYDVSVAPTVGTTTPAITIGIQATTRISVEFRGGIYFPTGIGIGTTTGILDSDTGAPAVNDVVINLFYKEE